MTVRYVRHPDLRLTALQDEGIVLHLGSRRYYTVSESGVDILEALTEPRTVDEIVAKLTAKYDVAPATAGETARAFLETGCRQGLIVKQDTR